MPISAADFSRYFPTLMETTGGILGASLTRIRSNKILSSSLALSSLFFFPFSVPCPFSPSPSSGLRAASSPSPLPQFPRAPSVEATVSPSSLGYDHLCAHLVELQPQFSFVEKHLDPFHALDEGEKSHQDKPRGAGAGQWAFSPQTSPNSETSPSLWSLWAQRLKTAPPPRAQLQSSARPGSPICAPFVPHSGTVS